MAGTFGQFFKELRVESGRTLRAFCMQYGLDPGNISKIERDRMPPPESSEKLEEYARALGLSPDTDKWQEFFDMASAARGQIPEDLLDDEELIEKLPVLFRTLRGARTDGDALDKLIDKVRRA